MKKSLCLLLAVCLLILPVSARASGVLYGDVNGDGSINAKDATLILRYSVGKLADLSKLDMAAANVNADDRVNAKDATLILRYSVKKLDKFPADTHAHSYEAVVTQPTCTADGYTTYTCACGDSYTDDVVKATGHAYQEKVTAPTCDKGGYTTYTCRSCGNSYTDDETDALGHSYKTETVAPTTEAEGHDLHTCSVCGNQYKDNYTDKLPAETEPETGCTEHSWGDWTSEVSGNFYSYRSCTACGEQQVVDGSGSSYSDTAAELINDYRESKGLSRLEIVHDNFVKIRAQEITFNFTHARLDGKSKSRGTTWYGECIATGSTAEGVVNGWIASTSHEPTLVDTNYNKICVAYNGAFWVVLVGLDTESEECTSHSWGNWTSDANGSYGSCTNCGQSITIDGSGSNYSDEAANLINEFRVSQGLSALTIVNEKTGLIRAQELTIEFKHDRLDGKAPAMYSDWYGENCGAGYGSASAFVQACIDDTAGHRETMLREKWSKVCVAYNGYYWIMIFG